MKTWKELVNEITNDCPELKYQLKIYKLREELRETKRQYRKYKKSR